MIDATAATWLAAALGMWIDLLVWFGLIAAAVVGAFAVAVLLSGSTR